MLLQGLVSYPAGMAQNAIVPPSTRLFRGQIRRVSKFNGRPKFFNKPWLAKQHQSNPAASDGNRAYGITHQAQLSCPLGLERHRDQILVPLAIQNQFAIHYVAWPVGKTAARSCLYKNQTRLLNPAGSSIQSRATSRLVEIRRIKMHSDRAVPIRNLRNF